MNLYGLMASGSSRIFGYLSTEDIGISSAEKGASDWYGSPGPGDITVCGEKNRTPHLSARGPGCWLPIKSAWQAYFFLPLLLSEWKSTEVAPSGLKVA